MNKDEVLAVLDKVIPRMYAHAGKYMDGSITAPRLEEARATVAALFAEVEQLTGIIQRDQAAAPDLMFIRALAALLHAAPDRSMTVSKRDVLAITLPPPGVSFHVEVEECDRTSDFTVRLVENKG